MCYVILQSTNLKEYFEDLDILALIIAALGHDLNHSGVGNTYY